MTEKDIQKMMKSLDLTRDEAIEMLLEDEAVDKMSMKEVNDDLTDEQKKVIKKASATQSKERKSVKRERKVDEIKLAILTIIEKALAENVDDTISRKTETELHFKYSGEEYTLKLIKHRPPKASKQTPFVLLLTRTYVRPGPKII